MKSKFLIPSLLFLLALSGCAKGTNSSTNDEPSDTTPTPVEPAEPTEPDDPVEPDVPEDPDDPVIPPEPEDKYDTDPTKESLYANQAYLNYVGNIQDVWNEYRGDGVTIAIIDHGFYIDHEEFKFKDGTSKVLETSASFVTSNNSTTITKGRNAAMMTDGDSHGTICATVAAGSITGTGTVGIAPNANLMLLKIDKNPYSMNEAFKYAADNGAKVITVSLGTYNYGSGDMDAEFDISSFYNSATEYAHKKGVVICSAAGNGGEDGRATEYTYPGAADYVIGCGGLKDRSRTEMWSGTSYNYSKSSQFADVFAPANNLYSGCYFDRDGVHYDYDGGFNGTSFASPIVAGAAALYFQKYPNATNTDFERALFNTCDEFGNTNNTGYGAINIKNLMNYEKSETDKTFYFKAASWWSQSNAATYAFLWNSAITSVNGDFPGVKMNDLGNNYYSVNIDTSIYDWVIFTRRSSTGEDWNGQTEDIYIDSFGNNNCFVLTSTPTWYSESGTASGTFSTYNL